ncbi:MAG: hypothetical protein ACHQAY_22305 [Hyphomicrobiales bacterium]
MSWIFALLGLATMVAGGGAIAMGWPLVPLERGWTMVIAGAAFASGGLVCLALAVLMAETRRMRRAIERALGAVTSARPIEVEAAQASPFPARLEPVAPARTSAEPAPPRQTPAPPPADHRHAVAPPLAVPDAAENKAVVGHERRAPDDSQPARSFSVGDTTFVVFADGSIEARTPQGTKRFHSMEEVRIYLESSAA